MDIAALSTSLADMRLADQVGTKVLSMALKTAEGQGASLQKLISSAEVITDPDLGTRLDTSA
jgi:hypothetical protein